MKAIGRKARIGKTRGRKVKRGIEGKIWRGKRGKQGERE